MWELWPSTPQAARILSVNPSSPGRPTWYMTSFGRSSVSAPDAPGAVVERFIPTDLHPFAFAALARALERVEDAIRIGDLVDCRWAFGAVSATRTRVLRVPLKLPHLQTVLINIGQESAS